ncbi:MarR family transcriptional regulator [Phenylobacterium sp.]|uniref:MarR family winged helix-turn-helix transcriptional regulator n=1 Tax=Phenylobacterium sp. TaxID=1871053 RepID=UPI00301E0649
MDLASEDSLGFQVRRCHRAFDRLLNARLARHGLSSGFWGFLRALWQESGVTQARLSQLNNVTAPTAVTTLNAMARAGLVRRERDPADGRKLHIFLTPRGRRLKEDLVPMAQRINEAAAAGISPEDLRTTLRVLDRISANLAREIEQESAP